MGNQYGDETMKTIYKYEAFTNEPKDVATLTLPKGAIFRSVREQGNTICVWFEVDADITETEERKFVIYGTGHPFKDYRQEFLGAFFPQDAQFVFHVYEVIAE